MGIPWGGFSGSYYFVDTIAVCPSVRCMLFLARCALVSLRHRSFSLEASSALWYRSVRAAVLCGRCGVGLSVSSVDCSAAEPCPLWCGEEGFFGDPLTPPLNGGLVMWQMISRLFAPPLPTSWGPTHTIRPN